MTAEKITDFQPQSSLSTVNYELGTMSLELITRNLPYKE
jgi:hypothetical protein